MENIREDQDKTEFLDGVVSILGYIGSSLLLIFIFLLLWNFIADYFGYPKIDFWVAAAIYFLLKYIGKR